MDYAEDAEGGGGERNHAPLATDDRYYPVELDSFLLVECIPIFNCIRRNLIWREQCLTPSTEMKRSGFIAPKIYRKSAIVE
jgi:hypothetical protein